MDLLAEHLELLEMTYPDFCEEIRFGHAIINSQCQNVITLPFRISYSGSLLAPRLREHPVVRAISGLYLSPALRTRTTIQRAQIKIESRWRDLVIADRFVFGWKSCKGCSKEQDRIGENNPFLFHLHSILQKEGESIHKYKIF
jgi:hypothetical protein